MEMKLYQIKNEYLEAFDRLSEIEGITQEEIKNSLAPINENLEKKSVNVASFIKNLEAQENAMKDYIDNMKKRKSVLAKQIEGLKEYLKYNMQDIGIKKIECPEFSISIKKSNPSVDITQESEIPDDYRKVTVVESIDRIAILKDLKEGVYIPGAKLLEGVSLTISGGKKSI